MTTNWLAFLLGTMIALGSPAATSAAEYVFPNFHGLGGIYRLTSPYAYPRWSIAAQGRGNFFLMNNFIEDGNALKLGGTAALSFTPFSPVELGLTLNTTYSKLTVDDRTQSITAFHDLSAGIRVVHGFARSAGDPVWHVGAFAYLKGFSGGASLRSIRSDQQIPKNRAGPIFSPVAGAIFGADFRPLVPEFPLRSTANIAFRTKSGTGTFLDNSGVPDFARWALDSYPYHAISMGIGGEFPTRFITVKGEYTIDRVLAKAISWSASPARFTLGVDIHPTPPFAIGLASDIGVTRKLRPQAPRTSDYMLHLIASYVFLGTQAPKAAGRSGLRGTVVDDETGKGIEGASLSLMGSLVSPVSSNSAGEFDFGTVGSGNYTMIVERSDYQTKSVPVTVGANEDREIRIALLKPTKLSGRVSGVVTDAATGAPLGDTTVSFPQTTIPPVTTNAETGLYTTPELPEQEQLLKFEKAGYEPLEASIAVVAGETVPLDVKLASAAAPGGTLRGTVQNEKGNPLTAVFVNRWAPDQPPFATNPSTGEFSATFPPGLYEFTVTAENYLPEEITAEVRDGQTETLSIVLKKPEEAVVVKERIILPDAIYFKFDSAEIYPASYRILDQIVGILDKSSSIRVVRIEGHTDSDGTEAYNERLSARRARAVADYLIGKGIGSDRLVVDGFGETRPIATNDTAAGKAENRRVEFHIVQQE